ncbi:MAG: damage-inducible protein DinB [Chloroflexi bacterium]|nr:MAG: damage-inducible protein DinB [Chloroflexota bacterium]
MPRSPLADAFAHHVWATLSLIDTCEVITDEQLQASAPGVYGSIIDTLRHIVASDRGYLAVVSGGRVERMDDERLTLAAARSVMELDGEEWARVLAELDDPERIVVRQRPDGSANRSPAGIRLAQALHHGTDHRSQICTILTTLGIEPPDIDVWEFGVQHGRVQEVAAPATKA